MQTELDCYPCLLRQALTSTRYTGADKPLQHKILNRIMQELIDLGEDSTPPLTANIIHTAIREETGAEDPYQAAKAASTAEALALYPRLKKRVQESGDPFNTAVRLAIAGNIIDFSVSDEYNLLDSVERVLSEELSYDDTAALRQEINAAPWVLYLADNAGETVFDRLLIEQIAPTPIIYVVKDGPALNDATIEDAKAAGLDGIARLVTTGYAGIGVVFEKSSPEFCKLFQDAPVIIAKGMGNFESLSELGPRLFFLLQAKCDVVAGHTGARTKGLIVRRG